MRHFRGSKAFTLIEILIAILLIGAIGIATFSLFYRIVSIKEMLSQRTMVRADLDAMTREIERALVTSFASGNGFVFKGTSQRIDVPCRIERLDALMATLSDSPSPPVASEGLFSMWYDASTQQILASTAGPAQRNPQGEALVRSVSAIRMRYRVGDLWEESFTPSQRQGLPKAVEVSIWLGNSDTSTQDLGGIDASERNGEPSEVEFDDMEIEGTMPTTPADVSFVVTVPDAQEVATLEAEGA